MDTQDLLYLSLHLQQETKRSVLVSHLLSLAKWGRSGGFLPLKGWLVFEIMRNFAFMTLSFDSFDLFEPGAPDRQEYDPHPPSTMLTLTFQNAQ